jgi:hypothetical protein
VLNYVCITLTLFTDPKRFLKRWVVLNTVLKPFDVKSKDNDNGKWWTDILKKAKPSFIDDDEDKEKNFRIFITTRQKEQIDLQKRKATQNAGKDLLKELAGKLAETKQKIDTTQTPTKPSKRRGNDE